MTYTTLYSFSNGDENKKRLRHNPNRKMRECLTCKKLFTLHLFYMTIEGDDYEEDCICCHNEKNDLCDVKQCNNCKRILKFMMFPKDVTHTDGLRTTCSECRNTSEVERRKAKGKIKCEFCEREVMATNIKIHQKTLFCLEKQRAESNILK